MHTIPTRRCAIVAVALGLTLVIARAATPAAPPRTPALGSLPFAIAAWSGVTAPPLAPDVAAVLNADHYIRRYYRGPDAVIEMDVAYYGQPKVGANMHSPLSCLPGNGWEVTRTTERTVSTSIGPVV